MFNIKNKNSKLHFCILFWLIFPFVVFSQEKTTFSYVCNNKILSEILNDVEKNFNVRFSYSDELVKNTKITLTLKKVELVEVLNEISLKSKLNFEKINNRYYYIKKSKFILNTIQRLDDVMLPNYLTGGIYKNKNATFQIIPEKFDLLPGLTETDILESIQQLPGVVSPNETATGLLVRGGSADQNRVIWDGINIYHNGHLFGMISAFNPNITKNITFYNKATNPRFGERISSVIDISSNDKISEKMSIGFGVNGLNADFFLETPIIANKLSIQTSFRRSFAELYESFSFDKLADKVFQNTKINNAKNSTNDFFFSDYNLKLNFNLNEKSNFHFSLINIDNNLDFVVSDIETSETFNDKLKIKNEGYSLSWNQKWSANNSQYTIVNFSKYKFNYNFIKSQRKEQLSDFNKRNVIFDSGVLSEVKIKTNENDQLALGYQYSLKDVSFAFILLDDDFEINLDNDQTISNQHSFFSNYKYHNRLFDFEAGFRVNYFKEFEMLKFEPRILIHKEVFNNVKIQLTGEIKNQVISQIDETILSDLSLENRLWRLANEETFPVINSNQISAGIIYKNKGWSFDLDFYKKNIKGVTALSLGFLNPNDSDFHIGNQDIMGIDFYLKKDFKKMTTWLNYSFSDVKNEFDGLNNNRNFIAGNQIKNSFTSSITYKIKKLQIALAWKWRSGKPFTEALNDDQNGAVSFEEINTKRLSNYHRMDLSSTYQFYFSKRDGIKGKVGFSIRNLYDQKNQLSREYTGNNSVNDPIQVVDKFSLGFTPNVLFRVYW